MARKMLQFTSVTNFTCKTQPVVIFRSRILKQIFVPPPFISYHSLNMAASEELHGSPLSATTQNFMDRQTIALEHHGDIKFCILETHPFQQDKR